VVTMVLMRTGEIVRVGVVNSMRDMLDVCGIGEFIGKTGSFFVHPR
jgi:hypothetical protein